MIDITLEYQGVIYLDGSNIKPDPKSISKLSEMFSFLNLLPSTYYEATKQVVTPEPRIMLVSQDAEWRILFGMDRLVISKNPTDLQGTNVGTIKEFCDMILEIHRIFAEEFQKRSNRLSLVSGFLLKEMTEEQMNAIFSIIANCSPTHKNSPPYEWNWRAVSLLEKEINHNVEQVNFISALNRLAGKIQLLNERLDFDRVKLKIDINTYQNNKEFRFVEEDITSFFTQVVDWQEEFKNETLQFIHKE